MEPHGRDATNWGSQKETPPSRRAAPRRHRSPADTCFPYRGKTFSSGRTTRLSLHQGKQRGISHHRSAMLQCPEQESDRHRDETSTLHNDDFSLHPTTDDATRGAIVRVEPGCMPEISSFATSSSVRNENCNVPMFYAARLTSVLGNIDSTRHDTIRYTPMLSRPFEKKHWLN